MEIIETKVLVAILFGIIRFAFGILPIQICGWLTVKDKKAGIKVVTDGKCRILSFAIAKMQSFGGGVLFATCLLHMMPEVYYSVAELKRFGLLPGEYPYSQLIVSLGFFFVYFLEEISHWIISRTPQEPCRRRDKSHISSKEQSGNNEKEAEIESLSVDQEKDFDEEMNQELVLILDKKVKTRQQILRCLFIVLALSCHAIFEGLAIGLQHSVVSIWYLFTAVAIHSATILFCIGLEVYTAGTKVRTIVLQMLFMALTTPLGVIIGLVVSVTANTHTSVKSIVVVFLEGLSTGTILYITFFEILIREKERRACRMKRAGYIVAGFGLMAGLECIKYVN